ncbi:MAG: hypothetical protein ACL93V_12375 [Candidatus Electrothrix sp. YB6]
MSNDQDQNQDTGDKKSVRIQLIGAAIIAFIPAVAYLLGISFYQGYLSTFGIDSDIFPISTQYIYINAYHAVPHILINLLSSLLSMSEPIRQINPWFVLTILLDLCFIAGAFWWLKKKDRNRVEKSIVISGIALLSSPILLLLLVGTTVFWWSPSFVAHSAGQKIAEKKITLFKQNGCSADQKTELDICSVIRDKDGNILHEGLLIAINDKDIAMFKKDGSYIFSRQNNWVLQRKLH